MELSVDFISKENHSREWIRIAEAFEVVEDGSTMAVATGNWVSADSEGNTYLANPRARPRQL